MSRSWRSKPRPQYAPVVANVGTCCAGVEISSLGRNRPLNAGSHPFATAEEIVSAVIALVLPEEIMSLRVGENRRHSLAADPTDQIRCIAGEEFSLPVEFQQSEFPS